MSPFARPIFLVGFMGSGKSIVAPLLAGRLGCAFRDTDQRIETREGRSISAIFEQSGEGYFRKVEWEVLCEVLAEPPAVVATGGGLFLGFAQRRRMNREGLTVWLDVPLEVVRERVGGGAGRPLFLPGEPREQRALFERRRAAYALARVRVDASSGAPQDVCSRIWVRIQRFLFDS